MCFANTNVLCFVFVFAFGVASLQLFAVLLHEQNFAAHVELTTFVQILPTAGLAFTNHTNIFEVVRELKEPTEKRQKSLMHTSVGAFV